MPRMYPIAGTKQRARGRECMVYSFSDGRVIVDAIRPKDHMEMVARLWGHYGRGSIRATMRPMNLGEQYTEMPETQEVA